MLGNRAIFLKNSNDYESQVINTESIRSIANKISAEIERKLTKQEASSLIAFIREQKTYDWKNIPVADIRFKLAKLYTQQHFTTAGRVNKEQKADIVDIHEILKSHIGSATQDPDYEKVTNVDVDGYPTDLKQDAVDNALLAQSALSAALGIDTSLQSLIPLNYGIGQPLMPNSGGGGGGGGLGNLDNITTIQTLLMCNSVGNINAFLGKKDTNAIQAMFNPQAAYQKNYITLDTRHRDSSYDGLQSFRWTFLQGSAVNAAGVVNSLGNVQNLVKMMCTNIRIPLSQTNDIVFTNGYKRVSMIISELNSQSNIAQEGWRYHFMFAATLDGNFIDLHALPNEHSYFEFAKPITQLDTFTITFGNPFEPIQFDNDRMNMQIGYVNPATLTGATAHNLVTGDLVYISSFTTGNTNIDQSNIQLVNRTNGFNILVVDSFTVELYYEGNPLDLTTLSSPIIPLSVPVYFGSKRTIIPIEFTYISNPSSDGQG